MNMKRKKVFTGLYWLVALSILLGTALMVSPALAASNYTVRTLAELRSTLNKAVDGDTITLSGTIAGDKDPTIVIAKDITLTGGTLNNVNLKAANNALTLKGITVQGAGSGWAVEAKDLIVQGTVKVSGADAAGNASGQGAVRVSGQLKLDANAHLQAIGGKGNGDSFKGGDGIQTQTVAHATGARITATGGAGMQTNNTSAGDGGTGMTVDEFKTASAFTFNGTITGGAGGNNTSANTGGKGGDGLVITILQADNVTFVGKYSGGNGGNGAVYGGAGGAGLTIGTLQKNGGSDMALAASTVGGKGGTGSLTGGAGGDGVWMKNIATANMTLKLTQTQSGGSGGAGSSAADADSSGGNGGVGGNAITIEKAAAGVKLTGTAIIKGGSGGDGGQAPYGKGGDGGDGGIGIDNSKATNKVTLEGITNIAGGPGGKGGAGTILSYEGETGAAVANVTAQVTNVSMTPKLSVVAPPNAIVDTEHTQLIPNYLPEGAEPDFKGKNPWKSSNLSVATVDDTGRVTPVSVGQTQITLTLDPSQHGNVGKRVVATCTVYVTPPVTNITLDKDMLEMEVSATKTQSLRATVEAQGSGQRFFAWYSDNPQVATVESPSDSVYGTVRARSVGTAVITVMVKDGSQFRSVPCVVNVIPTAVKNIKLSASTMKLGLGASTTLNVTYDPAGATDKRVEWTSDTPAVATVDSNGKVTGKRLGKAVITATSVDGAKVAKCTVTVENLNVTEVKLSPETLKLAVGGEGTLKANILPAGAANKNITWTSSNSSIATVDQNGKVKGIREGRTTVTVITVDGGKTATAEVAVGNVNVTGVKLSATKLQLSPGMEALLTAEVLPEGVWNKAVLWTSSNTSVVTVDAYGRVKALAMGKAEITVTTVADKKTAKCTVTVEKLPIKGLAIRQQTLTLAPGKSVALTYETDPAGVGYSKREWASDNPSVVVVDANGRVTALKSGTAKITLKMTDTMDKPSTKEAYAVITVKPGGEVTPITGIVVSKELTVRAAGYNGAQRLGTVKRGEAVEVTQELGNWYRIDYNGGVAYVASAYVSVDRTGMVFSNTLTVRLTPDTKGRTLTTLKYGQQVTVLESVGSWYKIDYMGIPAYVAAQYIAMGTTEQTGVVNSSSLIVRDRASSASTQLGVLRGGDVLPVIGREGAWLRVEYKGRIAYIAAGHVTIK